MLTTLVVESFQDLQPDPQVQLLQAILLQMQKIDASSEAVQPFPPFKPTSPAIRVNVYWVSSLVISLSTALFTILAKQWVNYLLAGLSPVPATRGRHRQYRTDGLHRWRLPAILAVLPLLLHIALLLFFVGLVDFVWAMNTSVGILSAVLVAITVFIYFATSLLSYIYPECPFKTSVTFTILLAHELWVVVVNEIAANLSVMMGSLKKGARGFSRAVRRPRWFARRTLSRISTLTAEAPTPSSVFEQKKPRYHPLRISSLRQQDEKFISENTNLIDARVVVWMIHNSGRFADPRELGSAVMRFPHLVRYRRLMIQEGAPAFLERLLETWFDKPWPLLSDTHRLGVTSTMGSLAMMLVEGEVDGEDFAAHLASARRLITDRTPFLPIQYPQSSGQSDSVLLSPHTLRIVVHLLNTKDVPLQLTAFALRLSVQLNDEQKTRLPIEKRTEDFIEDIILAPPHVRYSHDDLAAAIVTVIYLALYDSARLPHESSPLTPHKDNRYWTMTLLNILQRAPINAAAVRQVCWALCTLSWASSLHFTGITIRPLVPRLSANENLSGPMIDLLFRGLEDPSAFNAATVALECILWNVLPGMEDDRMTYCEALRTHYGTLVAGIYRKMCDGTLPSSRVALHIVSLTRIAAYLAFFDKNISPTYNKLTLVAPILNILKYLVQEKRGVHAPPSGSEGTGALNPYTRQWAYHAACRFLTLFLDDPQLHFGYTGPNSLELLFIYSPDSHVTVGKGIASTMATLATSPIRLGSPSKQGPDLFILETFSAIVNDVFTADLRPSADIRLVGGWKQESARIVHETVRSPRNLLQILLYCQYPCVHIQLLVPAIHYIHAELFAGPRPHITDTRIAPAAETVILKPTDRRHPARQMARALGQGHAFLTFLTHLTGKVENGERTYPEMHILFVEVAGIAGYLAFFDRPTEMPGTAMVHALVNYLRALARRRPSGSLPVSVRRHAWGALGSMVALYFPAGSSLQAEDNPVRHFQFDRGSPEDIALSFITVFSVFAPLRRAHSRGLPPAHCIECMLVDDAERWRADNRGVLPTVFLEAALEMVNDIWDGTHWEEGAVRGRLLHHEVGALVRVLEVEEGTMSVLTSRLTSRIDMTRTHDDGAHGVHRRLTL